MSSGDTKRETLSGGFLVVIIYEATKAIPDLMA